MIVALLVLILLVLLLGRRVFWWAVLTIIVLIIASGGSHAADDDWPTVSDDWPRDGSRMICSVVRCWTIPLQPKKKQREQPKPSEPTIPDWDCRNPTRTTTQFCL
jgi:hypothetical protein